LQIFAKRKLHQLNCYFIVFTSGPT